jgi:hypothetical protein
MAKAMDAAESSDVRSAAGGAKYTTTVEQPPEAANLSEVRLCPSPSSSLCACA